MSYFYTYPGCTPDCSVARTLRDDRERRHSLLLPTRAERGTSSAFSHHQAVVIAAPLLPDEEAAWPLKLCEL